MPRFTPEGQPDTTADDAVKAALADPANADAAQKAMAAAAPGMATRMAESLGQTVTASAVFAAPTVRGRVTVIPVARARYGFGAGTGEEGSGGGGGVSVSPVGWIEITDTGARFRPLRSRARLVFAAVFSLSVVAGAIARGRPGTARELQRRGDAILGRVVRRRASRTARLLRRA